MKERNEIMEKLREMIKAEHRDMAECFDSKNYFAEKGDLKSATEMDIAYRRHMRAYVQLLRLEEFANCKDEDAE